MWWGKSSNDTEPKAARSAPAKETSPTTATPGVPVTSAADTRYDGSKIAKDAAGSSAFDPNKLPARQKLPPALQKIMDKQDKDDAYWDDFYDG